MYKVRLKNIVCLKLTSILYTYVYLVAILYTYLILS